VEPIADEIINQFWQLPLIISRDETRQKQLQQDA